MEVSFLLQNLNLHHTPTHVGSTADTKDMETGSTAGMLRSREITRCAEMCSLTLFRAQLSNSRLQRKTEDGGERGWSILNTYLGNKQLYMNCLGLHSIQSLTCSLDAFI
jgi:hypothetical protein